MLLQGLMGAQGTMLVLKQNLASVGGRALLGTTHLEKRTLGEVHFEQGIGIGGTSYESRPSEGRSYTKEEASSAAGHELELQLAERCQRGSVEPCRRMGWA